MSGGYSQQWATSGYWSIYAGCVADHFSALMLSGI
jgi:hypothetical protein